MLVMVLSFGLMVVWLLTRFLESESLVQGFMRIFRVLLGFFRRWAHLDLLPPLLDGRGERCRMYCSVPGPLQSVQRAEIWEVLVALQGQIALHVGVDNLNVV